MAAKPLNLSGVPNLDALVKEAKRLGCEVSIKKGTGEVRIEHPEYPDRLNMNSRRKDGSRALIKMLRTLQEQEGSTE